MRVSASSLNTCLSVKRYSTVHHFSSVPASSSGSDLFYQIYRTLRHCVAGQLWQLANQLSTAAERVSSAGSLSRAEQSEPQLQCCQMAKYSATFNESG